MAAAREEFGEAHLFRLNTISSPGCELYMVAMHAQPGKASDIILPHAVEPYIADNHSSHRAHPS